MQTPPSTSQGRKIPPPAPIPKTVQRPGAQHSPSVDLSSICLGQNTNQDSDVHCLTPSTILDLYLFFEQQGVLSNIKDLHDCLLSTTVTWMYQQKAIQEESKSNSTNPLLNQCLRAQKTLAIVMSRLVSLLILNPNYGDLVHVCRTVTQETRNLFFDFISVQQLSKLSFIFGSSSEVLSNLLLQLLPDCAVDGQYWLSFFTKSLCTTPDSGRFSIPGFSRPLLISAQLNVVGPREEDESRASSSPRIALDHSDAQHSKRRKVDNPRLQELATMASKT